MNVPEEQLTVITPRLEGIILKDNKSAALNAVKNVSTTVAAAVGTAGRHADVAGNGGACRRRHGDVGPGQLPHRAGQSTFQAVAVAAPVNRQSKR